MLNTSLSDPPVKSVMVSTSVPMSLVLKTKRSAPSPPVRVSSPAMPVSVLLALLPVMTLASSLPVPERRVVPVSVRFSTLVTQSVVDRRLHQVSAGGAGLRRPCRGSC